MLRAFRRHAGMPVERWLETLEQIERHAQAGDAAALAGVRADLGALGRFYAQLAAMARGYIADPAELEENLRIVEGWQTEAEHLAVLLGVA